MASDLRGELHDFQRFLDDKLDVCRSSISLEQALQQFREYQRDLQRFKDDTRQALKESAHAQSSPLDIDDVIKRGRQRLEQKEALASTILRGFSPEETPEIEGYEFFSYYHPARTVGGDFYDYIPMPDGRIAVVLADVCGRGITASLIVAKLASEFRICLLREPTPEAAIARMNNIFCRPSREDCFVTVILMVLHPRSHEVTIVNAGHMAPLLRHPDGSIEEIGQEQSGLPIGVADDMDYDPLTISLAIGDSLTAYTDGVPDAQNIRDEFFGTDRLLAEMSDKPFENVDAIGRHVIDTVRRFAGSRAQIEDICVSIFGRTE